MWIHSPEAREILSKVWDNFPCHPRSLCPSCTACITPSYDARVTSETAINSNQSFRGDRKSHCIQNHLPRCTTNLKSNPTSNYPKPNDLKSNPTNTSNNPLNLNPINNYNSINTTNINIQSSQASTL